jgi:hypothetical protein
MFRFRLIGTDGESVDPEQFVSSEPNWREGDRAYIRPGLVYRVVRVESGDDEQGVLVVVREKA